MINPAQTERIPSEEWRCDPRLSIAARYGRIYIDDVRYDLDHVSGDLVRGDMMEANKEAESC